VESFGETGAPLAKIAAASTTFFTPHQIWGVHYDTVPNPNYPGALDVTQMTFTFLPEPTTFSLLLLGFAGLAAFGGAARVVGTKKRGVY
jgi:hypothetical protein